MALIACQLDRGVSNFSYPDEGDESAFQAEENIQSETPEQAEKRIYRAAYRAASQAFAKAYNEHIFYILNHHDARLAAWIIAYTLELMPARGRTCEQIGKICGLRSRQGVDKEVQKFCAATGYAPSTVMKDQRASEAYREARIASIIENQEEE